jgi:predicted aspartyl protease
MIVGQVNANREAMIGLTVVGAQGGEQKIEALVDTGFTSSLRRSM